MIVYSNKKEEFLDHVRYNRIEQIVAKEIFDKTDIEVGESEVNAFKNSLGAMANVLTDSTIPNDCIISIEFHIPGTSKRADFIISGYDGKQKNVIIIELKQWDKAALTDKDGLVSVLFKNGAEEETRHPSYQAWTYATLLKSFNAFVQKKNVGIYPCAYLHNYEKDTIITDVFYQPYIEKAPVFFKDDIDELRIFIKNYIKRGDEENHILTDIDGSELTPPQGLIDNIDRMVEGKSEFIMIDDQKSVYENALKLAYDSNENNKNILIVSGGPGTGKSVIAINLLVTLNSNKNTNYKLAKYVTKTAATRSVYLQKLADKGVVIEMKELFNGSGRFRNERANSIPVIIVDEAHRLVKQAGKDDNGGDQIKEILRAACFTIFFIDENQRVHIDDYGDISRIEQFANEMNIKVHKLSLQSQFRCAGSDAYSAWVDHTLGIAVTQHEIFNTQEEGFDFRIFDNPKSLQEAIYEKNKEANKARLVAGYCWDWISTKDKNLYDIQFPVFDFKMRWNLAEDGPTWLIMPNSVTEVGCIHTIQGLEADYIGVIVGDDLVYQEGRVKVDPSKRSKDDYSIHGWRKLRKEQPDYAEPLLRAIIKNTYRTLMTRAIKGCYVYFTNKEIDAYFRSRVNSSGTS